MWTSGPPYGIIGCMWGMEGLELEAESALKYWAMCRCTSCLNEGLPVLAPLLKVSGRLPAAIALGET